MIIDYIGGFVLRCEAHIFFWKTFSFAHLGFGSSTASWGVCNIYSMSMTQNSTPTNIKMSKFSATILILSIGFVFANQKPFGESENHRDSDNVALIDDLATREMWNIATATDLVNAVGRQSGDLLTAMVIYIVVHGILFNPVFVLLVVGFFAYSYIVDQET